MFFVTNECFARPMASARRLPDDHWILNVRLPLMQRGSDPLRARIHSPSVIHRLHDLSTSYPQGIYRTTSR